MVSAENYGQGVGSKGVGDFSIDGGVSEFQRVRRAVGIAEVDNLEDGEGGDLEGYVVHGLDGTAADVSCGLANGPGPEPRARSNGSAHVEWSAHDRHVGGEAFEFSGVGDVGELEEGGQADEGGFGVGGGVAGHGGILMCRC